MVNVAVKSSGEFQIGLNLREIAESVVNLWKTKTEYLDYNKEHIQGYYPKIGKWLTGRHKDIDLTLPYSIEFDYRKHPIEKGWGKVKVAEPFEFPNELAAHKESMISKRRQNLYKGNLPCVRIGDFAISDCGEPVFTVQKAFYYDQMGSNLTADFPLERPIEADGETCSTLRNWDMKQAGTTGRPPFFKDSRLANTIGVSVGVYAKDKNGVAVPFKRKRSKLVAIYEGYWHVPFSFALAWKPGIKPGDSLSLSELIMQDWGHELAEELGMEVSDFSDPKPVAFARDLVRAGKPQFFFEINSKLSAEDMMKRVLSDKAEYVGRLRKKESDLSANTHSPELLALSLLAM